MAAAPACRWKATLSMPERREVERIGAALLELVEPPALAVSCFAVGEGWRLDAYFTEPVDAEALAGALSALLLIAPPALAVEAVPDANWVALSQAALPPVKAGRFTVHGSHDRGRVPRGPNAIEIDAGAAFGTAHHATTQGCLEAIDRLARRRSILCVLDLGCGSGVLAIAAMRALPRARALASDIDPVAVEVATANARQNGVAARIRLAVAAGLPRRDDARSGYDLVVANILAAPLIALAPRLATAPRMGGALVLSGLLTSQAREVLAAYLARGLRLDEHRRIAGWSTLVLIRTAARSAARQAPPRRAGRTRRATSPAGSRRR